MRNPSTIEAFYDWVKKQDPQRTYFPQDASSCAIYQYAKYLGFGGDIYAGNNYFTVSEYRGLFKKPDVKRFYIRDLDEWCIHEGATLTENHFYVKVTFGRLAKNIEKRLRMKERGRGQELELA